MSALPVTLLEFREWQRLGRFRTIREDCGIRGITIAEAFGLAPSTVYEWELGRVPVSSVNWAAYLRVIRGMMNHLEVAVSLQENLLPR